jgi:hypothetical protein
VTSTSVIIPFRDRGTDPLRTANLTRVLEWWSSFGTEVIVTSDGRNNDAQFNRHKAYNRGATQASGDILVYVESDMLIDFAQIDRATKLAAEAPRLVVPFTARHELSPDSSELVREHKIHPKDGRAQIVKPKPRRIGAINIISRDALAAIGKWDEQFEGCWWDDRSMHIAFDRCTNPTQWIDGPAWHLYHLPGYEGAHLTPEDKAATARNQQRWRKYRAATPEQIRQLTQAEANT